MLLVYLLEYYDHFQELKTKQTVVQILKFR